MSLGTTPGARVSSPACAIIPIELRAGHVILTASVNGATARLILDSGSSVSTLDAEWAAPLSLPTVGGPVMALGTGDPTVTLATVQSIALGDIELGQQTVAIVPLRAASAQSGITLDGTVGRPLFARYVVEIDYARRELRLFEPASYEYTGHGVTVALDLARGVPIMPATIVPRGAPPFPARLVLDIGTSGLGVLFTTPFAITHAAAFDRTFGIEMSNAVGVGGAMTGRVIRLDRLEIGGLSIHAPTAALPRNGAGFFDVTWADGTIGTPIYERTTLIIDYSRSRAILEPGPEINAPFLYDASGLELVPQASGAIAVISVATPSAASDAGIEPDDVVISVDGRPATGERLDAIRESLRTPGETRTFVVARRGRDMRFKVLLRARI
ncbi:MAG: aspartyl protease family protein [bacterium]